MRLLLLNLLPATLFCTEPSPTTFVEYFHEAGQYYDVNPSVPMAIGKIESGYNPYAYNLNKNGTYDIGIMQINTVWLPDLKKHGISDPKMLFDSKLNIYVGTWILKKCINRFGQSWKAIDCYNKGPGNAQEHGKYVDKFAKAIVPTELYYQSLIVANNNHATVSK